MTEKECEHDWKFITEHRKKCKKCKIERVAPSQIRVPKEKYL